MEEEPAALRATSPEAVRQQLAEHYPGMEDDALVRPHRDDPQAACVALADAYQAYWDGALADVWPTMRRLVEDEVLVRARTFAIEGIDACLVLGLSLPARALALGALGLRMRDVFHVSKVASPALLLLTGANVPRQPLPGWMRTTGDVPPLTHAADAARRLADGGGIA